MNLLERTITLIRSTRKSKKLTQKELSDKTGYLSYMSINNIENGRHNVSIEVLEEIAKGLGVSVKITFEDERKIINKSENKTENED